MSTCAFIYIVLNGEQKRCITEQLLAAIFLEYIHSLSDEVKRDSLPSFFLNGGFGISLSEWENSWMSSERDQLFEVGQK